MVYLRTSGPITYSKWDASYDKRIIAGRGSHFVASIQAERQLTSKKTRDAGASTLAADDGVSF
jgi:hypothetical protein